MLGFKIETLLLDEAQRIAIRAGSSLPEFVKDAALEKMNRAAEEEVETAPAMINKSIYIPADAIEKIDRVARERGMNQTEFLRDAVLAQLDGYMISKPPESREYQFRLDTKLRDKVNKAAHKRKISAREFWRRSVREKVERDRPPVGSGEANGAGNSVGSTPAPLDDDSILPAGERGE